MEHKGLNQLLCAATVNGRFRNVLLSDPAQALALGYFDHTFSLTPEERTLVVNIQAQRLEDFAAEVHHWLQSKSKSNGNGNGHKAIGCNGNGHHGPHLGLVDLYHAG